MTEQHPQEVQERPQDTRVAHLQALAQQDERQAAQEAAIAHLQGRVVALNVEVRVRDEAIATLEQEKAALEARLNEFLAEPDAETEGQGPDSGEPGA